MTEDTKQTVLHHLGAMGRDVLTISAVIGLVFSVTVALTRTYWAPFIALPTSLAIVQREVAEIQETLQINLKPEIVAFQGRGSILSAENARPGGNVTIFYSLKRNVSCDTVVRPFFYDVDRGLTVAGPEIPAVKAPVTQSFIPFKLDIALPPNIPPGRYVYFPEIIPVECGVYGPLRVPPTATFVVRPT